jgi:hypothetical protein
MAINVPGTAQKLAEDYKNLGNTIGLTMGPPGNSGMPANEPSGGGYVRQQTTWTAGSGGVYTGSQVTFDVPGGGNTYTYMTLLDSAGDLVDWCPITPTSITGTTGKILVTPQYRQS